MNIGDQVECIECEQFYLGQTGVIKSIHQDNLLPYAHVILHEPKYYPGTDFYAKHVYMLLRNLRPIQKRLTTPLPLPG